MSDMRFAPTHSLATVHWAGSEPVVTERPDGARGALARDAGSTAAGGPTTQLLLEFDAPPRRDRHALIVTDANRAAVELLCAREARPGGAMILVGPAASGKSHMVSALAPEAYALQANDAAAAAADPSLIDAGRTVVLEDLDRTGPHSLATPRARAAAESGLFHLFNQAAARGARVLITARIPPARWAIDLPDLSSRLRAAPLARIEPPDDAMMRALLAKLLEDRGVRVEPRVLGYVSLRLERSFEAAAAAADRLDEEAMRRHAPITTALAASALRIGPQCI